MRCVVDKQDLVMWGNYDSAEARNIMIVFETCDPETSSITCKSNSEIKEWLLNKYFLILSNEKKFVTHKFDSEKI